MSEKKDPTIAELRPVRFIQPEKQQVPRNEKGQVMPGFSLNPDGKHTTSRVVREFATSRSMEAMKTIYGIMNDGEQKTADRLAAARVILHVGGAMVNKVQEVKPEDPLSEISADDLKKFLDSDGMKS